MRISFLFVLIVLLNISFPCLSQEPEPRVSLAVNNQPLREVIRSIQSQTGLNVIITEKMLASAKRVTLKVENMPLSDAMALCLQNTNLAFQIVNGTIIVKEKGANKEVKSSAMVSGRVTDRNHQPVVNATVSSEKNISSVVTDNDGRYRIEAAPNDILWFTHVNYQRALIAVKGRTSNVDVMMDVAEDSMSEVVISTGYQKISQQTLTGSVTSLKMDSINQPGLTSVDKMLEGRVPGMIYMQNSGQPGAAPKLRVRGTSTLLGTQEPLWVIDGIPQTDPVPISANRINDLDFVNLLGNAISGLNPSDIDQIDVLKDAAATALYGVRAANGVIVVTTKRGKSGPPTVNYSISGNYVRRPRYSDKAVNMMNSAERVDVSREIIKGQLGTITGDLYDGYEKAIIDYYNGLIDSDTYHKKVDRAETLNTDWFDILTHDVFSTNHNLSLSGGTLLNRYYASLGYTNEQGVIKGEASKRYTGQLKYDINYKNFKAQFDISVNQGRKQYHPEQLGILNYAYGTSRAMPLYNEDGSLYFYTPLMTTGQQKGRFNILNEINHSQNTIEENTYRATANFNYQVVQGLQLEAVVSYTGGTTTQETWFDESTQWAVDKRLSFIPLPDGTPNPQDPIPFGGELDQQIARRKSYTVRGQASFSKFVDKYEKHQVSILVGTEASSQQYDNVAQKRRGYYPDRGNSFAYIDPFTYIGYAVWAADTYANGGGTAAITNSLTNLVSGYATSTYNYRDRYAFSASMRSDFSNSFGSRSNEKLLPTWSLGARWNIHNDVLMNTNWIDLMALRISYGKQGNMLPYQTPYTIIERGGLNSLYNAFTARLIALPNPNLKWEQTSSYNAGVDFVLFKNRISGTIGYFYKRTRDAFLSKIVSQINGVPNYTVNSGILENRGIELQFNFVPINNQSNHRSGRKGFVWRIDPQISQVLNKVLGKALNSSQNVLFDQSLLLSPEVLLNGQLPINGRSINTFYSYQFKGLNEAGTPIFYGLEPDQQEALLAKYKPLSIEDRYFSVMQPSGRREPVLQGGVSNYFSYNNFTLDFMFTYSFGNKIRLLKIASGNYGAIRPYLQQNLRKELVNRWRKPGDELKTNIPGVLAQQSKDNLTPWWYLYPDISSFGPSSYFLYDNSDVRVAKGDYVKLQSLNLRYNVAPSLSGKFGAKAAFIGIGGSNLFTLASRELRGQDPSQSGSSANITLSVRPVYNFFINVSF